MRLQIDATLDYHFPEPADVLLAIEAAPLPDQRLIDDKLTVDGTGSLSTVPGEEGIGRRTWLKAAGDFKAHYHALFEVERAPASLVGVAPAPTLGLPADVLPYLWPSRYCQSDRFEPFVRKQFGGLRGGDQVLAMADWVFGHLTYRAGTSDERTTAADTFVAGQGVCRDYAHLMASLCRAAGMPARLVSCYAWRLDPPDFHAVVEVWLEGGWHLVDATRLAPVEGLVRIAVGRDATDIAFMAEFGTCELRSQNVTVERVD